VATYLESDEVPQTKIDYIIQALFKGQLHVMGLGKKGSEIFPDETILAIRSEWLLLLQPSLLCDVMLRILFIIVIIFRCC